MKSLILVSLAAVAFEVIGLLAWLVLWLYQHPDTVKWLAAGVAALVFIGMVRRR